MITRWFLLSLALTAIVTSVCVYVGFVRTDLLMERIPTHWDIHMQPDQWTERANYGWYLLISPGLMLFILLLMLVLPWLSPKNYEIERFGNTFGFVMTTLAAYFGYMGCLLIWAGVVENPPYWSECFLGGFFGLFALMGSAMGKVRQNFWMGIRTPWTLASETVWDRTHRLAAWLWTGAGTLGAIAVFCGMPIWVTLIFFFAAVIWPAIYSLILYKSLQKNEPKT